MLVEEMTLEPYSFETGDQREPTVVTHFFIRVKIDSKWYKSEDHYPMEKALKIRDDYRTVFGH